MFLHVLHLLSKKIKFYELTNKDTLNILLSIVAIKTFKKILTLYGQAYHSRHHGTFPATQV